MYLNIIKKLNLLYSIFPFLSWFRNYTGDKFKCDFVAGITVALVVIPQSMAYAQLAGLPTYYGLYASFLPTIIASLFGSSRHLSTGPTAVVSLMTAVALEPLATTGSEAYIAYAILLALTVGLFRLSLGLLKLGLIVNFLPLSVVNGYTSAAAIIIATSQLSKIFGVYVVDSEYHYQTVINVIKTALNYTHYPTLLIAVSAIFMMYLLKRFYPKSPYVLIAVVIMTLVSWLSGYEDNINIGIDKLKEPEVMEMVKSFNQDMHMLIDNTTERSRLKEKIEQMKASDTNPFNIAKEQYFASLLGIKIRSERHESQILRDDLNNYMFEGAYDTNGNITFYKYGTVPKRLRRDRRIWRIKVRTAVLDENSLTMTGGGSVVGTIPKGIPSFSMPNFDLNILLRFLPMAAIISLLGFMESISIAKTISIKTGQRIDPNRELIGQGLANIIGSFGLSYPVSGSFSRSAINFHTGSYTGISNVVTSLIILLTLYFLTPLLYYLPKAVLASIILIAVIGLVNFKGFITAWKAQWFDGFASFATFIVTLICAPHLEIGLVTGISFSLVVYLYNSMRPRIITLSMAQDFALRSAKRYHLKECGYIAAIRFDGSLFFASSTFLADSIEKIIKKKPRLKHFLIVCNGINNIDFTGVQALKQVIEKIRESGYGLSFSGINEKVFDILYNTGVLKIIGKENIFPTQLEAIDKIYFETHEPGSTNVLACPLLSYIPEEKNEKEKKVPKLFQTLDEMEPRLLILTPTIGTEFLRKRNDEDSKR